MVCSGCQKSEILKKKSLEHPREGRRVGDYVWQLLALFSLKSPLQLPGKSLINSHIGWQFTGEAGEASVLEALGCHLALLGRGGNPQEGVSGKQEGLCSQQCLPSGHQMPKDRCDYFS